MWIACDDLAGQCRVIDLTRLKSRLASLEPAFGEPKDGPVLHVFRSVLGDQTGANEILKDGDGQLDRAAGVAWRPQHQVPAVVLFNRDHVPLQPTARDSSFQQQV